MVGHIRTAAGGVPVLIICPSCVTQVLCFLSTVQSYVFIYFCGNKVWPLICFTSDAWPCNSSLNCHTEVMWLSLSMGQLIVHLARETWRTTSARSQWSNNNTTILIVFGKWFHYKRHWRGCTVKSLFEAGT